MRDAEWGRHSPCCPGPYQAVQLGDGALAARLADVPDLHAALAAGVDVPGGVADGDGAHHLTVAQRVDLPGVPGDAGTRQRVVGEGDWLHLPIGTDVEGVGSAGEGKWGGEPLQTSRVGGTAAQLLGTELLQLSRGLAGPALGDAPRSPPPQTHLSPTANKKTKTHLRLPPGDGRQAGGQTRGSHGWVGVKSNLPRDTWGEAGHGLGTHSFPSLSPGRHGDTRGLLFSLAAQ